MQHPAFPSRSLTFETHQGEMDTSKDSPASNAPNVLFLLLGGKSQITGVAFASMANRRQGAALSSLPSTTVATTWSFLSVRFVPRLSKIWSTVHPGRAVPSRVLDLRLPCFGQLRSVGQALIDSMRFLKPRLNGACVAVSCMTIPSVVAPYVLPNTSNVGLFVIP